MEGTEGGDADGWGGTVVGVDTRLRGYDGGCALRSDGGGIVEPTTLQRQLLRQLLRQRARARPTRAGDRHGRDDAESVLETCRNGTTD